MKKTEQQANELLQKAKELIDTGISKEELIQKVDTEILSHSTSSFEVSLCALACKEGMSEEQLKVLASLNDLLCMYGYYKAYENGMPEEHLKVLATLNDWWSMQDYRELYEKGIPEEHLKVFVSLNNWDEMREYRLAYENGMPEEHLKVLASFDCWIKMLHYRILFEGGEVSKEHLKDLVTISNSDGSQYDLGNLEGISDKHLKILESFDNFHKVVEYYIACKMGMSEEQLEVLASLDSFEKMLEYRKAHIK